MEKVIATSRAPTNIAVVKYWGKNPKWEKWHIPNKSSLSFTVGELYTETTIEAKKGNGEINFELNGKKITKDMKEFEYVEKYIKKLRELGNEFANYDLNVLSKNNFPTAAGFASSASGFAAFAKALQGIMKELSPEFYEKYMSEERKLSVFARLGSGSATRSMPSKGGFVAWWRGIDPLNCKSPEEVSEEEKEEIIFSSYAESLLPPEHWKELRIIYVKVRQGEKKVKSRAGMKMTVKTNPLYWEWVRYEEEEVVKKMIEAVKNRDFPLFAELVMECSNGLHAMALYTKPRIVYLNDTSHQIIDRVLDLNEGETKVAYTFDAGPNAVLFTLEKYANEVKEEIAKIVGKENLIETKPGEGPKLLKVETV